MELGGEGEGGAGSAPKVPGWLNWSAGELSAYCVLGPLLTTSLSQLFFTALWGRSDDNPQGNRGSE